MMEKWTGDIIKEMHLHGITNKQLAKQLGYAPEYVSCIMNGKRTPKGAEQRFRAAVDELIRQQEGGGQEK